MKSNPLLPVFVAGSVALAEVVGPHEPHIELNRQVQEPQVVGMLATNMISTSTATVQIWRNGLFGWEDFH